jgi:hypothetical protein
MPDRPHTIQPAPQRDEAVGYRPLSGPAVAAVILAGVTTACVLVTWLMAWFVRHRPVLVWHLIPMAVISLALAIIGIRHVRRSGGARTGLGLARTALWLSVFCLGAYGAYYFAIDAAVRQQARVAADQFFARLAENKPELAFRMTRDPGQQRTIDPDAAKIRARFGATDLHQFDVNELARIYQSWAGKDRLLLSYTGPGERMDLPDGFVIQLIYAVRTPEGRFDVDVWARGVDDRTTGTRDWQILFPKSAVRNGRELTHLGRMAGELQAVCFRQFLPQWSLGVPQQKPEELASTLRVDGAAPTDEQRKKLLDEVRVPRAINLTPGAGPMRATPFPTVHYDPDGLRLVHYAQVDAPSLKSSQCPAIVTVRPVDERLVQDMLKLAGPAWESEPLLPNENFPSQLIGYKIDMRVAEIDFRPNLPSVAIPPSGGG